MVLLYFLCFLCSKTILSEFVSYSQQTGAMSMENLTNMTFTKYKVEKFITLVEK